MLIEVLWSAVSHVIVGKAFQYLEAVDGALLIQEYLATY
jgi:hypothetical protein